jgi:hypothetical protein
MLNELQVHIKPSRVVPLLQPDRDAFRSMKMGDTDFFAWDLPLWQRLCVAHIEQALDAGGVAMLACGCPEARDASRAASAAGD